MGKINTTMKKKTEKRVDGGRQYCDGWVDDAAKGGFREEEQEEEEEEEEEGEKKEEEQEALARPAPRQAEMVTGDTEHQKQFQIALEFLLHVWHTLYPLKIIVKMLFIFFLKILLIKSLKNF